MGVSWPPQKRRRVGRPSRQEHQERAIQTALQRNDWDAVGDLPRDLPAWCLQGSLCRSPDAHDVKQEQLAQMPGVGEPCGEELAVDPPLLIGRGLVSQGASWKRLVLHWSPAEGHSCHGRQRHYRHAGMQGLRVAVLHQWIFAGKTLHVLLHGPLVQHQSVKHTESHWTSQEWLLVFLKEIPMTDWVCLLDCTLQHVAACFVAEVKRHLPHAHLVFVQRNTTAWNQPDELEFAMEIS